MKMNLRHIIFFCLLPVSVAAQTGWSQDEAMGIVARLSGELNEIVDMSATGGGQSDTVKSKNSHAALVDLNILIEELGRLDLLLAAGENRAQTFAQYQKISNLRYSVQTYARDMEIPESIREKAEGARKLLRKLDLMYVE